MACSAASALSKVTNPQFFSTSRLTLTILPLGENVVRKMSSVMEYLLEVGRHNDLGDDDIIIQGNLQRKSALDASGKIGLQPL